MIHFFKTPISDTPLPDKFTFPFHYTPHPLCVLAAEEVKTYVASCSAWENELSLGKMFGVLLVQTETRELGYLAAYSGNLAGGNRHPFFVPPVYDLLQPEGFFRREEQQISGINARIEQLTQDPFYCELKKRLAIECEQTAIALETAKTALNAAKQARELRRRTAPRHSSAQEQEFVRESQHQKAEFKRLERRCKEQIDQIAAEIFEMESEIEKLKIERKERSAALQQKLFRQFRMLNATGETKDLCAIFESTSQGTPPAGAGECAQPKLLQYAYCHRLKPLAMAEFWWGASPKAALRRHGYYYPACKGKCEPILLHMLQGLEVDSDPFLENASPKEALEVLFDDPWLLVVLKPAGMLSVPGKEKGMDSVFRHVREMFPDATGPMIVHRLDMATSGVLLVAKTKEVHQKLQKQFKDRVVKKRYLALLDGFCGGEGDLGRIELPLCPDLLDRPRQMVSDCYGKKALTEYQILSLSEGRSRVALFPLTGRTHQLRVHAAHPDGLNCPIVGDELYGKRAERLFLHAESIVFLHPVSGETICVQKEADF